MTSRAEQTRGIKLSHTKIETNVNFFQNVVFELGLVGLMAAFAADILDRMRYAM